MAKVQAHLIINGTRVASGEADFGTSSDDPGFAIAQFGGAKSEIRISVVVERPEIDALKTGAHDFGLPHLRALLEALPRCSCVGTDVRVEEGELRLVWGEQCNRVALWQHKDGSPHVLNFVFCDRHAKGLADQVELPYAPAVRHIQRQQQEWEERFSGGVEEARKFMDESANQNPGSGLKVGT